VDEKHCADAAVEFGMRIVALLSGLALSFPLPAMAGDLLAGCGREPPLDVAAVLVHEGVERRLIVDVPEGYAPNRPHRLVVAFHGRTSPPAQVRRYYGLDRADGGRTIFVYPEALRQADGTYIWREPGDFELFDRIVERTGFAYCIAPDEVFAVGHSLGASFVNRLACARGGRLRAVASVAGGAVPAECRGEVAAMLLHHPEDELVPIAEGEAARDMLVEQNGLDGGASAAPAPSYPDGFNCRRYGPADAENPVLWCPHSQGVTSKGRYYPHQWPDGTGEAVMDFFASLD
jgi:polyhydroxybutyrate depolymerase